MRLIDADLLKTKIKLKNAYDPTLIQLYEALIKWIDSQPTVEAILSKDAISREETIKSIREQFSYRECYCDEYSIVGLINNLPPIYPKAKVGKWIECKDRYDIWYKCSECEKEYDKHYIGHIRYCPNCGAKMESEE